MLLIQNQDKYRREIIWNDKKLLREWLLSVELFPVLIEYHTSVPSRNEIVSTKNHSKNKVKM